MEAERASEAILIDADLGVWAHDAQFEQHAAAGDSLADTLTDTAQVGIRWPTLSRSSGSRLIRGPSRSHS